MRSAKDRPAAIRTASKRIVARKKNENANVNVIFIQRLVINCGLSFRAAAKVIVLLCSLFPFLLRWLRPRHYTNYSRWLKRIGLGLLGRIEVVSFKWAAFLDHT